MENIDNAELRDDPADLVTAKTSTDLDEVESALQQRERALIESEEQNRAARVSLKRDREALDRVRGIWRGDKNHEGQLPLIPTLELSTKTVKSAVLSAIIVMRGHKDRFTSLDIVDYLKGRVPFDLEKNKPNISAYLKAMVKDKALELVVRSSGRRPAYYKVRED